MAGKKSRSCLLPKDAFVPYFRVMDPFREFIVRLSDEDSDTGDNAAGGVATRTRTQTKKPTPYRGLLLNDDYTPMEFVVNILEYFFLLCLTFIIIVGIQFFEK